MSGPTYPCPRCGAPVPTAARGIQSPPCPACGWEREGPGRRAHRPRPPRPTPARPRPWWAFWRKR